MMLAATSVPGEEPPMSRDYQPSFAGFQKVQQYEEAAVFSLHGTGYSQVLELSLPPTQVLTVQPGSLMQYSPDLTLSIRTGDLSQVAARSFAGESMVRLDVYNGTGRPQSVSVASRTPGNIVAINLSGCRSFIFKRGAFIASLGLDFKMGLKLAPNIGVACFGGQGFILNEIYGQTIVFLSGCGSLLEKWLEPGEVLKVDNRSVLGFETTVQYDITCLGDDFITWCCNGQNGFITKFVGPGRVIIQSFPVEKLAALRMGAKNDNGGDNGGNNSSGGG